MNWAPKLRESTLRRLYKGDTTGQPDPDALFDVGWSFLVLCEDVVEACIAIHLGEVPCPECRAPIQRPGVSKPTTEQREAILRVKWSGLSRQKMALLKFDSVSLGRAATERRA